MLRFAYSLSLAALALLSCSLAGDAQNLEALQGVPERMQATLAGLEQMLGHVERYRYMQQCAVIGRGLNYGTAFETALKIKELTSIVAEPYSSADFRHGPIATVTMGFPIILVAPSGTISPDLEDLFSTLKHMQAERLVISDNPQLLAQAHFPLAIPAGMAEWLTPLVAIVPGQLFALRLALARGLDPDHPVGLRKVTETL